MTHAYMQRLVQIREIILNGTLGDLSAHGTAMGKDIARILDLTYSGAPRGGARPGTQSRQLPGCPHCGHRHPPDGMCL